MTKRLKYNALAVTYNDTTFYVAVLPVDVIYRSSRVSRADEDPETGYQRLLSEHRGKKIADYVNEGFVIPGALILSGQAQARIRYSEGMLSFDAVESAFLVIDGQHRLYGCHLSDVDVSMPVCIFTNLDLTAEVQYFLDVNGTQRGVPRTLQLEIAKFTAEPESLEDTRIKIFKELNERADSPLHNRLSPTRSVRGKLSHVPFKNAVEPVLELPLLRNLTFPQKVSLLSNAIAALETVLVESQAPREVTNSALFQAFFGAFPEILRQVETKHDDFKIDSFREVLSPLHEIPWDLHSGTNKSAIQSLTETIETLVSGNKTISDDLF